MLSRSSVLLRRVFTPRLPPMRCFASVGVSPSVAVGNTSEGLATTILGRIPTVPLIGLSPFPSASSSGQTLLTPEQVESFRRDGYLLLKDLIGPKCKAKLSEWTDEIERWEETKGMWMQYFEAVNGIRTLSRVENFLPYHSELNGMIQRRVAKAISELYGEEAVVFKEKLNFKLPGGAGFLPHQDASAYLTFGQKSPHITAMVCADASTKANGCLEVAAGFHKKGLLPQKKEDNSIEDEVASRLPWEFLETEAGDVFLFDSFVPHRSAQNMSDKKRRLYFITFNPKSEGEIRGRYYDHLREAFPPELERKQGTDLSEAKRNFCGRNFL
uniref:Uncharacterized protein n=1 Tax=Chromera velia CCMP2878 TaxID=1169474 RepID=A0A0G4GKA0_9ALVE|eukprot:Cvel_22271.t1-p1 / transcript=Cvel_22271.t1 / gene=Cvel_22271 / organism=Chromera_velia_CCMP2878 / gene_product=Ectoine hydroxylase, putative / transcript_product=Ectoine hydroxylase, putative / location=Cvel_scaffold2172:21412-22392(+) / protein_length=327 / sequence_SO=supercontig / SO=protein_coding / is_pseudo=false